MNSVFGYEPENPEVDSNADQTDRRQGGNVVEALQLLIRNALSSQDQLTPAFPVPHSLQRRYIRRPVAVRASCGGNWGTSECLISDLCEGGASVVCGHAPKVGEQVTLEWPSRSSAKPLRILCSVRHVSPTHTGLAFLGISDRRGLQQVI